MVMSPAAEKYREFWSDKTSPMSRSERPAFLRLVASELKLVLGRRDPVSVLEIGCGNGCLFEFLEFSPHFYRGVDFGPRMIEGFRRTHPHLDLIQAEGSSYVDDRTYDLILVHDVIAHFTPAMLAQHCRNARRMMHSESMLLWGSVLWSALRNSFDLGLLSTDGKPSVVRWGRNKLRRALGRDLMGHWYGVDEISKLARENSLHVRFHGSIAYPYRFHAVLSPQPIPAE
jgi:SAM-dependent methyltransferase